MKFLFDVIAKGRIRQCGKVQIVKNKNKNKQKIKKE